MQEVIKEEWKKVIYKGVAWPYEVSDMGRMRNGDKAILSCVARQHPYPRVTLCNKGKQHVVTVHRLVAEMFLGPAEGRKARHLDRNRSNNRVGNLKYGTQLDNENDKIRHGTHRCFKRILPMDIEYAARKERVSGMTCKAMDEKYGLTKGSIQRITKTPYIIGKTKDLVLNDIEEDGISREVGEQVLSTLSRIGYLKVL